MAENKPQQDTRGDSAGTAVATNASGRREASLVTEHGRTIIADIVVTKIVARAAREVSGVHDLSTGGMSGAFGELASRVTRGQGGVSVEVGQKEAAVDLAMIVDYGVSIPQVAEGVRRSIMNRVQAMTGLQVREVNVDVTDLALPEEQNPDQQRVQ